MQNRGFSLVEMAIVTMIIGILLVPLLSMYRASVSGGALKATEVNLQKTSEALVEFAGNNGRYPCPASLIIGPGEPNFGMPDCRDGKGYSGFTQPTTPGDCFAGICRSRGRDINGDSVGETILIGAVPYVIMNEGQGANLPDVPLSISNSELLPGNQTLDGWGNRMTYAVSEVLTKSATFNPYSGVISAVDENGLSLLDDPGTAHFVLVSHGDDGAGGYTRGGMDIDSCHIGAKDGDNCNQNSAGRFVSALRSLNPGPDYYDDMIKYVSFSAASIWENINETSIYNAPGGNVAVGKENATAKLDINGNIQAVQVHTPQFCGQASGECYDPALIAGDEAPMQCDPGEVMVSIDHGQSHCVAIPKATVNSSCPSGEVVVGISNLGNLKCCPVSASGVLECP